MLTAYSKWIKATENESMMADSDALLRNLEQCKVILHFTIQFLIYNIIYIHNTFIYIIYLK